MFKLLLPLSTVSLSQLYIKLQCQTSTVELNASSPAFVFSVSLSRSLTSLRAYTDLRTYERASYWLKISIESHYEGE